MKFNKFLRFNVPIKESLVNEANNGFLIKGVAINATTTRNNVTYLAEELEKAAPTLRNKPLLKDHDAFVDSIVGRTTSNVFFNATTKAIEFEAEVMDNEVKQKIRDGRLQSVSIGVMVREVEEVEDEEDEEGAPSHPRLIVRGLEFLELSVVAVPADPGAGLQKAFFEAWKGNQTSSVTPQSTTTTVTLPTYTTSSSSWVERLTPNILDKTKEDTKKMVELKEELIEKTEALETKKEELKNTKDALEETKGNLDDFKKQLGDLQKEEIKKQIAEIQERLKAKPKVEEKIEEKIDTTPKKEEILDKTKGEAITKKQEKLGNELKDFVVERSTFGKGYSLYRENYNDKPRLTWSGRTRYPWEA